MNHRGPLRPVTADVKRCLCVNDLNKLTNKFRRSMYFPFRGVTAHRHHIEIGKQVIDLTRTQLTYGLRTWFVCPRCRHRCGKLYSEGLSWYCKRCADLWFESQRQTRQRRLEAKAKQLRIKLGDYASKPGDPVPKRPYYKHRNTYRKAISLIHRIEKAYLDNKPLKPVRLRYRERDEAGQFMPVERSRYEDSQSS